MRGTSLLLYPSTTIVGSSGFSWHTIADSEIISYRKQNPQEKLDANLNCIYLNERQKSHCLANLAIKLSDFKMDLIKWQLNFWSSNFGLRSYLWFQIELALRDRSQTKLHSTQFNYHSWLRVFSSNAIDIRSLPDCCSVPKTQNEANIHRVTETRKASSLFYLAKLKVELRLPLDEKLKKHSTTRNVRCISWMIP